MGGTGTGEHRRSLLGAGLVLICSLALAGTSYAGAPGAAGAPRSVCGGLAADASFTAEVARLGSAHACEHLRVRARRNVSLLGSVGTAVRARLHVASAVARVGAAEPARVGRWTPARNPGTQTVGIGAVLLHTGDVLLLGDETNAGQETSGFMFNPVTGTGHDVAAPAPVFCGSLTPLSDGRVLTVGGADPNPRGIEDIWLFDPRTERWLEQPPTPNGRYYPTSTRLPDGRVLVAAGTQSDGRTRNPDIEVYTPPAAGGTAGTLAVVGDEHPTATYPHQLVMPDGRLLQIEGFRTSVLDPSTWSWTGLRGHAALGAGSAHLLLPGRPAGSTRVMVMGGKVAGAALARTQLFDYATRGAGWSPGTPMPTPRAHLNVVQVPDGSAYAIGGNSTGLRGVPQRRTMRYDAATGRWRNLAVQEPRRAYHSTALLLPDGRIMSAGDNAPGGGLQRIDFYSPPYLFRGPRPRITSAPARARYGGRFSVRTAGPTATRAVLMAPGATTHANEMNARHVPLALRRTGSGLSVAVPRASVAPPGYYMLFVLTADGVPSVARWVRVTR